MTTIPEEKRREVKRFAVNVVELLILVVRRMRGASTDSRGTENLVNVVRRIW